jgi:hypothetical protein
LAHFLEGHDILEDRTAAMARLNALGRLLVAFQKKPKQPEATCRDLIHQSEVTKEIFKTQTSESAKVFLPQALLP